MSGLAFALSDNVRILQLQSGGGTSGGIAAYISSLVGSAALSRFEFIVAVGSAEGDPVRESQRYGQSQIVEIFKSYRLYNLPFLIRRIIRLVRKEEVKFIHSHALRSGLICALINLFCGIAYIHTNHGLRFLQKHRRAEALIFRIMEQFVVSRAERVICIRPSDAKLLRCALPRYAQKIGMIVTRIDRVSQVLPTAPSLPSSPPRLIGIGSLIEVKRPDRFIDWLAALSALGRDCRAVWLGDGALRRELDEKARAVGVRVEWRGQVLMSEVAVELARSDIMLLTSDFEVLSLAALEAMAMGKPIVTTAFSGVDDFVLDGVTGIVLPANLSVDEIARRIASLLDDPEGLAALGSQARSVFEERFLGAEQMAGAYKEHYRAIEKLL